MRVTQSKEQNQNQTKNHIRCVRRNLAVAHKLAHSRPGAIEAETDLPCQPDQILPDMQFKLQSDPVFSCRECHKMRDQSVVRPRTSGMAAINRVHSGLSSVNRHKKHNYEKNI